jgi:hypothetical protein
MSAEIYKMPINRLNSVMPLARPEQQTLSEAQSESNALLNMFIQALTQKAYSGGAAMPLENPKTTTTAVDFVVDTLLGSTQPKAESKAAYRLNKMISHDPSNKPLITAQLATCYTNIETGNHAHQVKLSKALQNAGLTQAVNLELHKLGAGSIGSDSSGTENTNIF